MLIDIHVHTCRPRVWGRLDGSRYPDPGELVGMMDEKGIDMAVLLCRTNPEWAYTLVTPEEVLEISNEYPTRFIPFCCADPRMLANSPLADFRDGLRRFKEAGFKGIGEYVPNIPFDDPYNMNFFRHASEVGLPVTFHIAPAIGGYYGCYDELGLPRLEKVLREFPDLVFFGHSQPFWAEISADVHDGNRMTYPEGRVTPGRVVELMRRYPNLYGDLSAGSGYNAISRDPEFGVEFMREFQDRLFFGTDIADYPQETPIVDYFKELRESGMLSTEIYEKIAWKNANRVLRLGLE